MRKRSTLVAWSMLAIFVVGWTVMSVLLVANGNLQEPADGLAFLWPSVRSCSWVP